MFFFQFIYQQYKARFVQWFFHSIFVSTIWIISPNRCFTLHLTFSFVFVWFCLVWNNSYPFCAFILYHFFVFEPWHIFVILRSSASAMHFLSAFFWAILWAFKVIMISIIDVLSNVLSLGDLHIVLVACSMFPAVLILYPQTRAHNVFFQHAIISKHFFSRFAEVTVTGFKTLNTTLPGTALTIR